MRFAIADTHRLPVVLLFIRRARWLRDRVHAEALVHKESLLAASALLLPAGLVVVLALDLIPVSTVRANAVVAVDLSLVLAHVVPSLPGLRAASATITQSSSHPPWCV